MKKYDCDQIRTLAYEENVKFLRLMFTDINGLFKNIEVPISQLDKVLDQQIMFDGSSIAGFASIEDSDLMLHPDLDTWLVYPWHQEKGKTARLICDIYDAACNSFAGDPRGHLKEQLKKMGALGFTSFNVGPEPEFFLFKSDENGAMTTSVCDCADYADMEPIDEQNICRRDIVLTLEELGFEIEASHHEAANGQQEIDFKYADALLSSDRIQTFKMVVKQVARLHHLHATFMPKPILGINGSGMHCNLSLFDQNEHNAFYDPTDTRQLSQTAYHFIAGIMKHAKALTAICNPTINSYKRLVPGFEAPVNIAWSTSNRTPMIRIPAPRKQSTRVEVRSVDPTANPYLALSALLAAGLDGIEQQMEAPKECQCNIFQMTAQEHKEAGIEHLPANLRESLHYLKNDPVVLNSLGEHIANQFITIKEKEWLEYCRQITPWEWQAYSHLF